MFLLVKNCYLGQQLKNVRPIQIGDLVIICEFETKRGNWKRGKLTQVFPGKDGQIRSAEIQVGDKTFKRPASKLAVLELH